MSDPPFQTGLPWRLPGATLAAPALVERQTSAMPTIATPPTAPFDAAAAGIGAPEASSGLVLLAAMALAFVVSTQYLFQTFVWQHWPLDDILLGWLEVLRDRAVVAACIGAAYVAARRLPLAPALGRSLALGLGIALGAAVGEAALMALAAPVAATDAAALAGRVLRWSAVAAAVAALLRLRMRSVRAQSTLRAFELAQLESQAQLANLQLQALRSQIEPHFLFNTLATVRRLGATDPALRGRLLEHLHTFIRLSMAAQPEGPVWSLAQEIELVRAYLGVVSLRMDGRLSVAVDADAAALACALPPLVLATLVENAVKHGITPSTQAAEIRLTAQLDHGSLCLRVADTGVGFQASGGSGIGLANTRARLRSLYGANAALELHANRPRGVVALMRLPASKEAP